MKLDIDLNNTQEVLRKLKESCDEHTYSSFFRDAKVKQDKDNQAYLILSTLNDVKYIKKNFMNIVEDAMKHVFGLNVKITIVSENEFSQQNQKKTSLIYANSNLNKNFLLSDYVEADFNKDVVALGKKMLAQAKVVYNPLFIYSSSGMGKTHFLNAIGNELVEKNKKVCYINPNEFIKKITQYLISSDQEKLSEIVEYYKNFDFLFFDDIQQFGSKTATLNVLFNIINSNIENGKQIIITSDKSPELLGGFEERFISRFQGGITQNISQPSLNDLMKIFEAKLIKCDIDPKDWETEAIKFIVRNHSSSIRALEGAVNKIEWNKQNSIQNIRYTYNVVSQMFSTIAKENKVVTPEKIIEIIAKYYKITKNEILGKTRRKEIVLARQISMWMIRNLTNLTYKEIGRIFKGKDHTTVMASIEKIDSQMKINETVKNALKSIKEKINEI